MAFFQKRPLRCRDLLKRIGLVKQGANLAARHIGDQIGKHRLIPARATQQGQVLEIEGPHVQFDHRSGNRPGGDIGAAAPQDLQHGAKTGSSHIVDHDVDAAFAQKLHKVGIPIDQLIGADGPDQIMFCRTCHSDHMGAAPFGQLDGGRSDATRSPGNQHA